MQPVIDKLAPRASFRLGDFIFMMRENQIAAAAMEIKSLSQIMDRHGGAFNVPAGTSLSPGTFPERFTRFGPLPESKIAGIAFSLIDLDTCACQHVINLTSG